MKKIISTLLLTAGACVAQTTYFTKIIQTNHFTRPDGVQDTAEYDIADLDPTGTEDSPSVIMGRGVFQLIAVDDDNKITILDTESIASYYADADIKIIADQRDQHNRNPAKTPRTLVGIPYTVQFQVSDLVPTGPGVPEAASSVQLVDDSYALPPSGEFDPSSKPKYTNNADIDYEWKDSWKIYPYSNIAPALESWTFYMKPDPSEGILTSTVLESDKIQTLNLPDGKLSGYDSSLVYASFPPLTFNVNNTYPGEGVILQISGGSLDEPVEVFSSLNLSDVNENVSSTDPEELEKVNLISQLVNEAVTEDGTYTIKLLAPNPFTSADHPDGYKSVIFEGPIKLKGSQAIKVKGSFNTAE